MQQGTVWQRALLLTLYHVQIDIDRLFAGIEDRPRCWITRKAIEHALWFDWQTHHSLKAQELIDSRWLEQKTIHGVVYYALSSKALIQIHAGWLRLQDYRFIAFIGTTEQDMLPGFEEAPF